ncbi:chromosome segregation protein SMC [Bacillus horti]|uniref:Chromosome partition protein Smc n=1 Tax=Caldalkalibacillus horti TaxID=77523 RepID=A0ABT9W274_9BACI|nr:chromosome segregation protein SMC [Bacillus horti]MDQ0167348.1 chromosome segregation protein [Bacillus horti]
MYLKRLELYGFKSFADRTELEFVPGVTAVVGPNGSGKSNVSDSIRWVLGEQSAKSLRGAKMEDIIFAGSDTRKPVNYGEVTLVLDNSDQALPVDYDEVAITRRVYRSGDSEYLLNKQTCRLKDITELFMDTGLGKEAYSIIGQGRIEEILSTKSEDRRGIFEEAAGVVKYKSRKKEAERKLDETAANLVRIQDIIYEIEEQIEPLKEQSDKAKAYKTLKKELTAKEISTYVYSIETLHEKWEQATSALEVLKQQQNELSVAVNQEDAKLEQLKWHVSQIEQKLEQFQQQLLNVTEEVEKLEGQREVLRERKKNFSTNKQDILERIEALKQRQALNLVELEGEEKERLGVKKSVDETKQQLADLEDTLSQFSQNVDERLEKLKGDYIEILNEQASIKNDVRHVSQTILQNEGRMERLHNEHKHSIQEREKLQQDVQEKEKHVQGVTAEIHQARELYQQQASRRKEILSTVDQDEAKLRNYMNQYEKLTGRRQFLVDMKEEFNGFFQGVKEVLKARESQLKGIDGAVAELIQVPKDMEVAIETALGAALQHVVVKDEGAAREAIQFLKNRRLGRATFLPRSVIKARSLGASELNTLKQSEDFVGVAQDLIQFDANYQQVVGNLLGHVVIMKSLKAANEAAKKLQYRFRFVTLDGDVVNPGGSMTGGSQKQNQSNLLGRDREIEKLEVEIEKAEEAIQEKKEELQHERLKVQGIDQELEQLRTKGEELKEVEQQKKEELHALQFSLKHLDEKLRLYDDDMLTFTSEKEAAEQRKIEAEARLVQLTEETKRTEEEMQELETNKKQSAQIKEEKGQQITQLKVELARRLEEYNGLKRNVERLQATQEQLNQEWTEAQENLQRLEGNLHQQDDEGDALDRAIQESKEQKDHVTVQIHSLRQERKGLQHEGDELEIKLKELRKELRVAEEESHKEEVKANRLDVELENYLTLLREEYELSFEAAKESYPLEDEYEVVKREVERLKRDIQLLGTVNLGAIEEYERVVERYDFLKRQEDDLIQAKNTLYDVISEMDEEMSKRFKETFDLVREQFVDVFQQLFGGGRADLILSVPENLLNTGIDIVAQPPGKKLQHLALLSGGEKALTAIALLFAILRIKPVPFCVLDEVEAALDEANVSRFAHYLREFRENTQFIVITHRKGTMEGADVLYGITMQESGVSNLVSVKLEESERIATA